MPWLLSQQRDLIAQGLNQGISAAPAMCSLAAFALFVGSYQNCKLLDTRTKLDSWAATPGEIIRKNHRLQTQPSLNVKTGENK
ncbi:hypothetical protein ABQZ69_17975 [Xanthomonas sp. WHRI 8391]|uniref:hypothetical protein n=1 Tax=Xanthomonas TaxID=338 RepID=UPI001A30BCE1|nr:hypothetical protein [Xanthomonas hortorum]MBG3849749.1 hypothetical protein [Xanthomonas hortorum pv. carotae]UTS74295.1 hypothetical protein NMB96_05495 [Xanthomonas hortorum]